MTHKLYLFFIFNNLIVFTMFSTIWGLVVSSIQESEKSGADIWKYILGYGLATKLVGQIFSISPFWVMYLLQRYVHMCRGVWG